MSTFTLFCLRLYTIMYIAVGKVDYSKCIGFGDYYVKLQFYLKHVCLLVLLTCKFLIKASGAHSVLQTTGPDPNSSKHYISRVTSAILVQSGCHSLKVVVIWRQCLLSEIRRERRGDGKGLFFSYHYRL